VHILELAGELINTFDLGVLNERVPVATNHVNIVPGYGSTVSRGVGELLSK